MPTSLRRALRLSVALALFILTLVGIAAGGVAATAAEASLRASVDGGSAHDWATPSIHNPDGPIVVAVAVGSTPTVASDVLAPFEVFASSPRFSVYLVAASAAPAQLEGGPAVLPVFTFDQVTSGVAPRPDVVVVPAVQEPAGNRESDLRTFITDQASGGARILGICSGALVLAETGLLDGRQATSHWSRIDALESSRPQVHWVRGERFVQDGPITTTAGVTSGIPGALQVMADLAGPAEAERVGAALHYPGWSLGASAGIPDRSFDVGDAPVALNVVLPWLRPTLGIGLTDGDDEIEIAGLFEVYNVSYAARVVPVSARASVTTRHGLVLLTSALGSTPALDRLLVPGAARQAEADPALRGWAAEHHVPLDAVAASAGENGFDAALRYLARGTDRATARSAAKMIDYPAHPLLGSPAMSWRAPLLLAVSVLLAAGVAMIPVSLRLPVRRRRPAARSVGSVPSSQ